MRGPPLRLQRGAILLGQAKRGAIVDRRTAERLLALAPAIELLGGLVSRIEPPHRTQLLGRRLVERHALGLAADEVGNDAEPGQIGLDRVGEFGARAFDIGVVEA